MGPVFAVIIVSFAFACGLFAGMAVDYHAYKRDWMYRYQSAKSSARAITGRVYK